MKKIIIAAVLILSLNLTSYSQHTFNSYNVKEQNKNFYLDSIIKKPKLKDPFTAGMLSFLVPGAGQFHNGEPLNGAVRMSIAAACIIAFAISPPLKIIGDPGGGTESEKSEKNGNAIKLFSFLGYTLNWILAVVDASYSASHYNKKVLKDWNERKVNMSFDFSKNAGIRFSYRF